MGDRVVLKINVVPNAEEEVGLPGQKSPFGIKYGDVSNMVGPECQVHRFGLSPGREPLGKQEEGSGIFKEH